MIKSKFNSVFAKNVQKKKKTPEALKKYLNQDAPKGYHYEQIDDTNTYSLWEDGNNDSYGFTFRFKFPFKFEGLTINNIGQLLDAMYRTQKPYKLDYELQQNPPTLRVLNGRIDKQFIFPRPFEKIGPLIVKYGNKEKNINIKRVPYADFKKAKFVSCEGSLLFFESIVDENSFKGTINAKLNFSVLKFIDNYFENRELIRAFNYGEISMFGEQLIVDLEGKGVFEKNDKLYNALKLIQDKIGKNIEFPKKISLIDLKNTKIMFESIINHRITELKLDTDIELSFDPKKTNVQDKEKSLGKNLKLYLPLVKKVTIFNIETELLEYQYYSEMKLKEIKPGTNQMIFTPSDTNKSFIYYEIREDKKNMSIDEFEVMTSKSIQLDNINFTVLDLI